MNGCRLSQDQPSQTTEELFAHFGCQAAFPLSMGLGFFFLFSPFLIISFSQPEAADSSLARTGPRVSACDG